MENRDEKLKTLILTKWNSSISELCRRLNMPRQTMENILKGNNKHGVSFKTAKKICKYFKVDFRNYI